jgi:hypothetical protein
MKYIITENERDDRLTVLRRLPELKDLIRHQFPYYYPCDYDSLEQYMIAMKVEMFQVTVLDWFDKVDNDVIWDIVTDLYGYLIVENYTTRCKHKMH